jgi:dTDP-4-amino-4,6-dideoxygalactose transaminase
MIPYGRQSISEADIEVVSNALRGDLLTTGPLVEIFENELEKLIGAPIVTVTSGTAALHCAYVAIGVQKGDEVISPPNTFIATQATAALLGAKNVFVDIQYDTGNIDPEQVEAAITSRTKAIVAVDFAGHPADMHQLRKIADKHKIYLIEDAAHSLGSKYFDHPVGSLADITTFSFFPTKNIATGEGGAIASISPTLLERARKFSRQGLVRDKSKFKLSEPGQWHQEVHEFGLNYRLPDILCALGISQISRIQNFKKIRKLIRDRYASEFISEAHITLKPPRPYVDPMWHLAPIFVDPANRAQIFDLLRQKGIGVQVNYLPAYRHPVFEAGVNPLDFPESERHYSSEISLPIHANLSDEEINYICATVKEVTRLKFR